MDTYLLAIGFWNLVGAFLMASLFYESLGHKILVDWTGMFRADYKLGSYGNLWLIWAIGLNVFFATVNIMSAVWDFVPLKTFMIQSNIVIYLVFVCLSLYGIFKSVCGPGIYIAIGLFVAWISWGIYALYL